MCCQASIFLSTALNSVTHLLCEEGNHDLKCVYSLNKILVPLPLNKNLYIKFIMFLIKWSQSELASIFFLFNFPLDFLKFGPFKQESELE